MFLRETQIPKVQKLGVQRRIVFLPVGGGVGQFEIQTQTWAVNTFCNSTVCVCWVLHCVSQIVCLLPGSGWRPQRELHSDRAGVALQQDRRWGGQGLVSSGMGSRGEKRGEEIQKGRIKTQPIGSDTREMTKGDTTQRWFPDAFIRLKFVMTRDRGILMYLACIGQILAEKRNNS